MEKIQRLPRGLSEVLSLFGGRTPQSLADEVTPIVDTLQFFGLSFLQTPLTLDAALASGTTVDLTVPDGQWWMFYRASASVTEQAALTSLQLTLGITYPGSANQTLETFEKKAGFIAGDESNIVHVCPYPVMLPPRTRIRARARFAGVATVAIGVTATIGALG